MSEAHVSGFRRMSIIRGGERGQMFATERLMWGMLGIVFVAVVVAVVVRSPMWNQTESGLAKTTVAAPPVPVTMPIVQASAVPAAPVERPPWEMNPDVQPNLTIIIPREAPDEQEAKAEASRQGLSADEWWADFYRKKMEKERLEAKKEWERFYKLGLERGRKSSK